MKLFNQFSFSSAKNYHLITIGPYANQVSQLISHSDFQSRFKKLSVQYANRVVQPSLHLTHSPYISLQRRLTKFSDVEMGVMVKQIIPETNTVILKNGNHYTYNQLVYSGSEFEWLDTDYWTDYGFEKEQFLNYSDFDFENIKQLYSRNFGTIIFLLPDQKHFGYDNYFMLHLKSFIEKNSKFKYLPLNIKILNLGSSVNPFSKSQNQTISRILHENNIEIINNCKLQYIDNKSKKIYLNHQTIKYDGIFYYTPLKTPQVLKKAKINPFYMNKYKLHNSLFQNIHIIGNVTDNTHSFSVKKNMINTIAKNVLFKLSDQQKRVEYEEKTKYQFWTSSQNALRINSERNKEKNTFFQKCRGVEAKIRKHKQIDDFFNFDFNNFLFPHSYNLFSQQKLIQGYNSRLCPIPFEKEFS